MFYLVLLLSTIISAVVTANWVSFITDRQFSVMKMGLSQNSDAFGIIIIGVKLKPFRTIGNHKVDPSTIIQLRSSHKLFYSISEVVNCRISIQFRFYNRARCSAPVTACTMNHYRLS